VRHGCYQRAGVAGGGEMWSNSNKNNCQTQIKQQNMVPGFRVETTGRGA
jgi:hypothetical protein